MPGKTLTKAAIVDGIFEKTDRTRSEVISIVETLLRTIKRAIKEDNALMVSGFGKFETYGKKARRGRNPHTEESIILPPRKVVVFRLSRKFRVLLNPGE